MDDSSDFNWTCSTCGSVHSGIPDNYSYEALYTWHTIPERERPNRAFLDSDYCVIDSKDYFVRDCLEIPVVGMAEPLVWGIWVSLSKSNWERERELASDPNRVNEPHYFGWLSTRIEIYPDTFAPKTNVHTRAVGVRPAIELQLSDHPLSVEQRTGVSSERLIEIATKIEHLWRHPKWNSGHY